MAAGPCVIDRLAATVSTNVPVPLKSFQHTWYSVSIPVLTGTVSPPLGTTSKPSE